MKSFYFLLALLSCFHSLLSLANIEQGEQPEQQLSESELAWLFGKSDSDILEDSPTLIKKENKKSTLQQLVEMDKKLLQQYISGQKIKRKYTTVELEALKVQISDILKSATFMGLIPKKARLIKISDNSLHYTTREIKVKAYRKKDFENCFLLRNKDGSISYKVAINNITPIDDMINTHEQPRYFTPIVKKNSETTLFDPPMKFQTEFNFHFGLNAANFTRDLINDSDFLGLSNRFEIINYVSWNFPIKIGLSLGLQQDYANLKNNSKFSGNTFYFAPSIKSNLSELGFDLESKNLFATAMLKSSIFSNMTVSSPGGIDEYSFYNLAFSFGLQKESQWTIGNFIYGFDIQRQWTRVTGDNSSLTLTNNSVTDDSITFKIGLGKDW